MQGVRFVMGALFVSGCCIIFGTLVENVVGSHNVKLGLIFGVGVEQVKEQEDIGFGIGEVQVCEKH